MGKFKLKPNLAVLELDSIDVANIFDSGDSEQQAMFFNDIAFVQRAWRAGDKDGMQFLYIKDELNDDGKAWIRKLYEYTCEEIDTKRLESKDLNKKISELKNNIRKFEVEVNLLRAELGRVSEGE